MATQSKTFTSPKDTIEFDLDGQLYHCLPGLPFVIWREFMETNELSAEEEIESFFSTVLTEADAARMKVALVDREGPEYQTVVAVYRWLLEVYAGVHPTQPPSDSLPGQEIPTTEPGSTDTSVESLPIQEPLPVEV